MHYSASGFWPTAGVFMVICRRGRNVTNHRFRLPVILQPSRRRSTSTRHRHHYPHSEWRPGGDVWRPNKSPRQQRTLPHHASGLPRNNPSRRRRPRTQALYCTSHPVHISRPRRLAPDRLRIANSEFEEMLRSDTAQCYDRRWASPLHIVPKKEDCWRLCGD